MGTCWRSKRPGRVALTLRRCSARRGLQEPVQRGVARREQRRPRAAFQAPMLLLVRRNPIGHGRGETASTRLLRGQPDRAQGRQQRRRLILPGAAAQGRAIRLPRARRHGLRLQRAHRRFAMIAQQPHGLIQQGRFLEAARFRVLPAQARQHFFSGCELMSGGTRSG